MAAGTRILVLGAGATGAYFGGRLATAGHDVTFLVRGERAERLAVDGLHIKSPMGDFDLVPQTALAVSAANTFEIVLLTCKAYDLGSAIAAIAPAVAEGAMVLPFLNGLRHLDDLDAEFGADRVFGGVCQIAATLAPHGVVLHLNRVHAIVFGPRTPAQAEMSDRLASEWAGAGFDVRLSPDVVQDMWEKWVMLATLAGATCLMRATIGDIVSAPGGEPFIRQLLGETASVAAACGHAPRRENLDRAAALLTEQGSTFAASMLRDVEAGGDTEADHVLGDLIFRAEAVAVATPLLQLAYTHLKAHEARRGRQASGPPAGLAVEPK